MLFMMQINKRNAIPTFKLFKIVFILEQTETFSKPVGYYPTHFHNDHERIGERQLKIKLFNYNP